MFKQTVVIATGGLFNIDGQDYVVIRHPKVGWLRRLQLAAEYGRVAVDATSRNTSDGDAHIVILQRADLLAVISAEKDAAYAINEERGLPFSRSFTHQTLREMGRVPIDDPATRDLLRDRALPDLLSAADLFLSYDGTMRGITSREKKVLQEVVGLLEEQGTTSIVYTTCLALWGVSGIERLYALAAESVCA